jgi:hypothetical protein
MNELVWTMAKNEKSLSPHSLVTRLNEVAQVLKFFVTVRLILQPADQPICQ